MKAIVRTDWPYPSLLDASKTWYGPRIEARCCEKFAVDISSGEAGTHFVSSASLVNDWKFCPWCGGEITFVNGGTV